MLGKIDLFLLRSMSRTKSARLRRSEQQNILMARDIVKLRMRNKGLLTVYEQAKLTQTASIVIDHLTVLLKLYDPELFWHSARVAKIAGLLAREFSLAEDYCNSIERAALLHDIGIIALPNDAASHSQPILLKHELKKFEAHTVLGKMILSSDDPLLQMAARIALCHHECYDGSGYPFSLRGDLIPIEARIVAIADYIEGLFSGSHGTTPLASDQVYFELNQLSGTHFDPAILRVVDRLYPKITDIFKQSNNS